MDVHKQPVLSVFDAKQRLEVPLFQRQYVWNEEQHWLPLWEDIHRKFVESLETRENAPVHFLGAMVLDQKQTPTGHVVVRQIIDGQQRLTTLQIFLAAFRDFCKNQESAELADECEKSLINTGLMSEPDVDKYKVWPTQRDRDAFIDVVESGTKDELVARHPIRWRKYARKPEPRPAIVNAYLFFYGQIELFILGEDGDEPTAAALPIGERLDKCLQALRSALMVVVIDLDSSDDPQVIFETLNARGAPLLPADLLRNYIFFRVKRAGLDISKTYETYWEPFDEGFWREEVKQGRLTRPRSDLFMQHFLASQQGQDIPIKHLYVEYRHWLERTKPFKNVTEELESLARNRGYFRQILDPQPGDVVAELARFLEIFDVRTAYPFLLALMDAGLPNSEWKGISEILESYLVRRAVCNLGTKNYNKIFLSLTRTLRREGFGSQSLRLALSNQYGESSIWPDDVQFKNAWLSKPVYSSLGTGRLTHMFLRLNQAYLSSKSEPLETREPLSVEHILPQEWIANWPLTDGSKGMTYAEMIDAEEGDPRATQTRERERALDTIGNLTVLSVALNSAQSNLAWKDKRPELGAHSLLPINQQLAKSETWDEAAILRRGEELFRHARSIWPR
jgi:uncharacterized protein with ParB-like and HNH nuclease domain